MHPRYILVGFIAMVMSSLNEAFKVGSINWRSVPGIRLLAVPDWVLEGANPEATAGVLTVRFINTPSGKDVLVKDVPQGANLLAVGDNAGVKLPRACRTGLCGSCTCEVQVPGAIASNSAERDGFAMIRACSARCSIPEGMSEMVVDVHRMRKMSGASGASTTDAEATTDFVDPMARFSGDWEREFRPMWEQATGSTAEVRRQQGDGSVQRTANATGQKVCPKCNGAGRVSCYACDGKGSVMMGFQSGMSERKPIQCATCVGLQTVGCGFCGGTGMVSKKK
mmetsp:Transcript_23235/g.38743  ORF Transcript_23235/g.38743 Transcript_23235/m.38743 type:complete len:281 (-) Transcript_23235:163-1005(-)